MKKILLCLCFVFAVGLLFNACGKDDKSSSPAPNTVAQEEIDGKNVELYPGATGEGKNIKWKVVGYEILIRASAFADGDGPELTTTMYLKIDNIEYTLDAEDDSLKAELDGADKTSEIRLEGQYIVNSTLNFDNPQVGQYQKRTYKITSLYGQSCNKLTFSFTIRIVDNF